MIIKDLFINLCILIALTTVYLQIKWNTRLKLFSINTFGWFDGIAGGILGNCLMFFSIKVTDQTIVDLRYIPIMLVVIFNRNFPAFISAMLIIIGRFLYGVNLSSIYAAIFIIMLLIGFILIEKRLNFKKDINRVLAMILFGNISFSIILIIVLNNWDLLKIILPWYWFLSSIGGVASVYAVKSVINSHTLLKKYENESTTDFLTGLNNVRQFDNIWNVLAKNAKEKKEKLSLLVIDIDLFKKVNDTYGHSAGDLVLKELGQILKNVTRSFDIVSRNGGEEFTVILPDCPRDQAMEKAEKIRQYVENHSFPVSQSEKIKITASIGAATFPDSVSDIDQLMVNADECLYKAKRLGRNKVISI